ncbi:MAG: hypothetical protein AAB437_00665 [Patescibacteria group bacterium]
MDIFNLLSYINKVSLLAFVITTIIVGYQVYVLKKEKTKEQKPFIPDFKNTGQSKTTTNYTRLPSFLTKKDIGAVNYSKLIFLIIFLLTVIVIIVVLALIRKNNSSRNEALVTPTIYLLPSSTPTTKCTGQACLTPTVTPTVLPPSPTTTTLPTPTEIVLAKTTNNSPTPEITKNKLQTLPETGSVEKVLLLIGVAVSTILFSFGL